MKRILKLFAGIILLAILLIGIYVAYVFVTSQRIEDKQELQISQFAKEQHLIAMIILSLWMEENIHELYLNKL